VNEIVFPDSVEKLSLNTNYPLDLFIFPENLIKLTIYVTKNQDIKDLIYLPDSLKYLRFENRNFNQDVSDFTFPKDLIYLRLGGGFNQDISGVVFPEQLYWLGLGNHFDQDISGVVFPEHLRVLSLGTNFSQDFSRILFPRSLRAIEIGNRRILLNDGDDEGYETDGDNF
jgi:hypothetical protein